MFPEWSHAPFALRLMLPELAHTLPVLRQMLPELCTRFQSLRGTVPEVWADQRAQAAKRVGVLAEMLRIAPLEQKKLMAPGVSCLAVGTKIALMRSGALYPYMDLMGSDAGRPLAQLLVNAAKTGDTKVYTTCIPTCTPCKPTCIPCITHVHILYYPHAPLVYPRTPVVYPGVPLVCPMFTTGISLPALPTLVVYLGYITRYTADSNFGRAPVPTCTTCIPMCTTCTPMCTPCIPWCIPCLPKCTPCIPRITPCIPTRTPRVPERICNSTLSGTSPPTLLRTFVT
jgi:hypothetical protein